MALLDKLKRKKKKEEVKQKDSVKSEEKKEKKDQKIVKKKAEQTVAKKTSGKQIEEAYRIIKEPHITERANFLANQNQYVFKVYPRANKIEIKKAIEALYGVKAEKVRIIHSPAKKRRLGRFEGWRRGEKRGFKKAIVSLKEGDKIELMPK